MNQAQRTSSLLILLLLALLITAVPPTSAQEEQPNEQGITIQAEAGFDGYYKAQFWVPVQVSVANNGPTVEGEIRLVTGDRPGDARVVYNAPISLPTQSNKRLTLFVGAANTGGTTFTVELLDAAGNVAAQVVTNSLRQQNLNDLLYGVVSSDPGELDFLENVRGGRGDAAVAFLDIEDLPTVAPAWNALDILLFNDIDTGQLTADQLTALQGWVSTGGELIISGGPGWQKTAAAFSHMLPVTLTGSESAADLPALSEALGHSFRDPGPYLLAASSLRNGELLYHQDGLPLLARQDWGRGSVYFLALDPKLAPLLDWDGSEVLFNEIASNTPVLPPWAMGVQTSYQAGEAVTSLPTLALPSATQLIIYLFVYVIVIGPVNYFWLKRTGRRELAWVTIPALVILFTGTAYVMGFQLKGNDTIINQINIVYGQVNSDQARVQTLIGLYSPRRSRYNLLLPANVAARPFNQDAGSMSGSGNLQAVSRGNNLVMNDVLVDVSDVETFVADSYQLAPSISGQAEINFDGSTVDLDVSVQNNSQITLENATILIGSIVFSLGDLPPGGSLSDTFTLSRTSLASGSAASSFGPTYGNNYPLSDQADKILGTSNYYNDPIVYPRWQLLSGLGDQYYGTGVTADLIPDDVATLIAWSDEAQVEISLDAAEFNSLSTSLYFLEIPVERNLAASSNMQIPAALLNWEAVSVGGGVYEPGITNLYLSGNSWVEFEYSPWSEFANIEVTQLAIRLLAMNSGSGEPVPFIRLWDWEQEVYIDVEGVNWGSTAVPEFQRFLSPINTIRLHVRTDNSAGTGISEIYPVLTGNLE